VKRTSTCSATAAGVSAQVAPWLTSDAPCPGTVEDQQPTAALLKVRRHAAAHRAQPDESELVEDHRDLVLPCLERGTRQAPHRKRDKRQQDKRNDRSDDSDHSDGRYCARQLAASAPNPRNSFMNGTSRPGTLPGDFKAAQFRLHA